jgi:hypothetical protein
MSLSAAGLAELWWEQVSSAERTRCPQAADVAASFAASRMNDPAGKAVSMELVLARERIDPFGLSNVLLTDGAVETVGWRAEPNECSSLEGAMGRGRAVDRKFAQLKRPQSRRGETGEEQGNEQVIRVADMKLQKLCADKAGH